MRRRRHFSRAPGPRLPKPQKPRAARAEVSPFVLQSIATDAVNPSLPTAAEAAVNHGQIDPAWFLLRAVIKACELQTQPLGIILKDLKGFKTKIVVSHVEKRRVVLSSYCPFQ